MQAAFPRAGPSATKVSVPAPSREDLWRQAQFFLLEAGLLGAGHPEHSTSAAVVLALCVLAVLPVVSFGAANDFVMRVSIPSLTVLRGRAPARAVRRRPRRGARQARHHAGGVGRAAAAGRGHALAGVRARGDPRCVARESGRHTDRRRVRHLPGALRRATPASRSWRRSRSPHACLPHAQAPDHTTAGHCENPALRLRAPTAEAVR